jgi:hypothetical protein
MIRTLLATLLLGALALPAVAIEVAEVVAKANHAAYYQGQDGRARVKMSISDAQGRERVREFTILRLDTGATPDAEQKLYVYFQRPADVSRTTFLVWKKIDADDHRWLYLPALDLVKRIAASDERSSFVGSHFFYEDVSGRVPDEDTHELIEDSQNYYVVQSTPKDPQRVEFASYRNWIHRGTFLPVKTEFLDASGKAYRTYEVLKVETIGGFPTVMESRMSDTRIGGSTTMSYLAVSYDIGLPEELFSERFLRNPPREHLK